MVPALRASLVSLENQQNPTLPFVPSNSSREFVQAHLNNVFEEIAKKIVFMLSKFIKWHSKIAMLGNITKYTFRREEDKDYNSNAELILIKTEM